MPAPALTYYITLGDDDGPPRVVTGVGADAALRVVLQSTREIPIPSHAAPWRIRRDGEAEAKAWVVERQDVAESLIAAAGLAVHGVWRVFTKSSS